MDIQAAVKASIESSIANSCRRVLFNHVNDTNNRFHVDLVYGSGTGILIFFDEKFFLLTPKHVINNTSGVSVYQNDSPFWIPLNSGKTGGTLRDFLYPKYYYDIGALISFDNNLVDSNDICLIELFDPMPLHQPNNFIDLTKRNGIVKRNEFFEGQLLIAKGFPFEDNTFDYDLVDDNLIHSTTISRRSMTGFCELEKDTPYINFEFTDIKESNPDGMSGSVVLNVWDTPDNILWAGLSLSASKKIMRFLPAWCIFDALTKYQTAERHVIDPIAEIYVTKKLND